MNEPKAFVLKVAGFSLVELLVAVVLLAVGALGAVTMQRTAIRSNQATFSREVAVSLARELLERTKNLSYYDSRLGTTGGYVAPPTSLSPANPLNAEGGTTGGRIFTRTWEITHGTVGSTPNLKTIRVRVRWNQAGQASEVSLSTLKAIEG